MPFIDKNRPEVPTNDPLDVDNYKELEKTGFFGKYAAGILFLCIPTGRILLGHRSNDVEQPLTWGTFGGAPKGGEQIAPIDLAIEETYEETGYEAPKSNITPIYVFQHQSGFRYFNFLCTVDEEFSPHLNWENIDARWFSLNELPRPLHFGLTNIIGDDASMRIIAGLTKREVKEDIRQWMNLLSKYDK